MQIGTTTQKISSRLFLKNMFSNITANTSKHPRVQYRCANCKELFQTTEEWQKDVCTKNKMLKNRKYADFMSWLIKNANTEKVPADELIF